jgi:NifB/MoaA-like Fe-S oxidoreductase
MSLAAHAPDPAAPVAVAFERTRQRPVRQYERINSIVLTEPRIDAIRRELRALLAVVQLEAGGVPIEIDGFRLRDNSMWSDYPTSLSDIFWHLSSVCNFRCQFCYEKGNPDGFPIENATRMATDAEIETRLRHYDKRTGRGLFTVRTAINEPFVNPRAVDTLERLRAHNPDELLSFVTNGSYFTPDVVARLARLRPIFFNLSLYSTDEAVRRTVLGDRRPGNAVRAVELLAEHRVPYMTNVVMWPSIPLDDLDRTVAHAERNGATVMRVCLGGYSRYLDGDFERFEVDDFWPAVVAHVDELRTRHEMPILIEPNTYVRPDTDALVEGVVVGSSAHKAGLRRGDELVAVNGERVASRMQAMSALRRAGGGRNRPQRYRPPGVNTLKMVEHGGERDVALTVRRSGELIEVTLDRYDPECMARYPYAEIAPFDDFVCGIVLSESLRYSSLAAARDIIRRRGAARTLVLTSSLMHPQVRGMIDRSHVFDAMDVALRVARNEYFGGTINIGDLLVVDDFVTSIEEHRAECGDVDLVLVPASAFASSPWGRDLTGVPWRDIERRTRIAVELVPCSNITY